jgi:hypothetical protein
MSSVSFSSVTSERLAWSFKVQLQGKNLDKKAISNYADAYWEMCMRKGDTFCPFPEYLVKYYHSPK